MAGQKPFFLTGGNAKIMLNNMAVAFATNVTYRVEVKHATPRVLGKFEVEVIQPLAYIVTGTMTVIRYSRNMQKLGGAPPDTNAKGNSVGSYSPDSAMGKLGSALGIPSKTGQFDGGTADAFDPARMFQSKMFNIEIRHTGIGDAGQANVLTSLPPEKGGGKVLSQTPVGKAFKKVGEKLNAINNSNSPKGEVPVVKLRDCRFDTMEFQLNKRGVATMNLSFTARFVDEDGFIARKSGVGQELS